MSGEETREAERPPQSGGADIGRDRLSISSDRAECGPVELSASESLLMQCRVNRDLLEFLRQLAGQVGNDGEMVTSLAIV